MPVALLTGPRNAHTSMRIGAFAVMEDGKGRKALACACWWLAVRGEVSTSMGAVAFAVVEDWKWGKAPVVPVGVVC